MKWREFFQSGIFEVILAVISLVMAIATTWSVFPLKRQSDIALQEAQQVAAVVAASKRASDAEAHVKEIESAIASSKKLPSGQTEKALAKVQLDVKDVSKRLESLESALAVNPERALAVPLLRKDVDSVKENTNRDLLALQQQVNATNDWMKWLFGTTITLVLAVLAIAIKDRAGKVNDSGSSMPERAASADGK